MNQDIREIESITFGVYSPEEILNMSVCKVESAKKSGYGTVYDPRMGTTSSTEECETCKQNAKNCPGHFGHIELNESVVHPLYYKRVTAFLNCFCIRCYRLLITKEQIYLAGLNRYKGESRFDQIQEKLKKVDICCQQTDKVDENGEYILCGKDKPKIKFATGDSSYSMIYEEGKKNRTSIVLSTEEIKKIFDNILPEDVELLGFDPELVHPKNFIISILPVCPPSCRPYVKADGKTCDDDLTIQLCEIIKANNNLVDVADPESEEKKVGRKKKELTEQDRVKARASLRFRISTMFNNCLAPDTPIKMWSGSIKRADEIRVGDELVGDDGAMRIVLRTCQGIDEMYEITQKKGDTYVVNQNHILTLHFIEQCKICWKDPGEFSRGSWQIKWYDPCVNSVCYKTVSISGEINKQKAYDLIHSFRKTILNKDGIFDIPLYEYNNLCESTKKCFVGLRLYKPIVSINKKFTHKFFSTTGIIRVKHIGRGSYVGFTVDKNQRFLLGDLTVTHNSGGRAKHTTNGRAIKGYKERLTGKDGQIRSNMMGKRSLIPDTPIYMWSGEIKRADEIKIGDVVVGDDGLPRTVVNTVTGESPLYKVVQSYGEDYGISCEHILTLKYCAHAKIQWRENMGKYGGWFMQWYDRETKTCKTEKVEKILYYRSKDQALKMMENIKQCYRINPDPIIDIHVKDYLKLPHKYRRSMLGVKLSTPIQWKHKDVKLDPRILGMLLGNEEDQLVFSDRDSELAEYFQENTDLLENYNIFSHKHIPEEYIINDANVRRLVLAGLIDSNGLVEDNGRTVKIFQSHENKEIIDGAERIALSLGLYATVINSRNMLELTISGNGLEKIPTLLPRNLCSPPKNTDMSCYIIKVIENGFGKFFGFEVDQNNRFLLGDTTITHNCDQTGRTVIGPDPTLKMGELAIPEEMARILTIPVRATSFNITILQQMIDDGKIMSLVKPDEKTIIDLKRFRRGTRLMSGDIIHRNGEKIHVISGRELVQEGDAIERSGEFLTKLKPANRKYNLELEWIVNRPLQNGDYVLLNRQPTLHKASMMAMQVVVKPHKTFRMNLAITKPFNADFDGDEMNIHVPQTLEAQAELKLLSAAKWNMISPQSSKPNMAIVQDSLVGAYRMTQGIKKIEKGHFFDIMMKISVAPWSSNYDSSKSEYMSTKDILSKIQHIRRIMKEKGKKVQCFTGHGLVSMFLPNDFNYEQRNDKSKDEPVVRVYRGVLYEGTIDKTILGSSHNAMHQVIHKEYGVDSAAYFIDCIQFVTNQYLLIDGFSVGLGDCLITQDTNEEGVTKEQQIRDVILKCYVEAEAFKQTTVHPVIREIRINAALNKAKDIGLRIAKDALDSDNNFLSTVHSGSKGDFFNIAQITGLLGQQNLKGRRIPLQLNHGKRSLPHYPFGDLPLELEYESRGFIDCGFLRGLNPKQFFFHSMSGREGVCDTAMGTATSGYMQRRIIKLTEDMKIQCDGTVRDITGKIYQMSYGETGIDPTCTVKVNKNQEICDISRLVDRLNMTYELENNSKICK